ncbi:MAG: endopeptidase La [Alphaproteobacteria bacterium]
MSKSIPFELPLGTVYPVLPLRDVVVFPHMVVPLFVGRDKSIRAIQSVAGEGKPILLVTQKRSNLDDPTTSDLYSVGTIGQVLQILKMPDGTVKALIEGKQRVKILRYTEAHDYFEAYADVLEDEPEEVQEDLEPLRRTLLKEFESYVKLNKRKPAEILSPVSQLTDTSKLADTVASHIPLKIDLKQNILEKLKVSQRIELIIGYVNTEIELFKAEKRIQNRIRNQVEQNQREYYLTEQLKAIQKELGESDEARDELRELEERIEKTKLSKEAKERAKSELKKLKNMNPIAAEATVVRNYLDWLLSIPWDNRTKVRKNLSKAEAILNEDHYGLEKVKERILEFLAVQTRVDKVKGPILCLVGPPGVGKTSLGKSIAKATGRQFVRISVGGLRDESEIRGHRRTYIGSMPGKIVQGMRKAKSSNPLFLLDEIDKMGSDWRGDPSSALLEVLDPEQNTAFNDHYLEVDYDLSDVLFVTTANSLNMPLPLLDRMEIIRISGYTEDEKVVIAQRHLVPKQRELHGLKEDEFSISEEGLRILIRKYCRESGVRNLEREIASLSRKAVKSIVLKKVDHLKLTKTNLEKYAGIPRYRFEEADLTDLLGITTGLAWTEVGGELLSIEAVMLPGKGKIMTTGKLGEVMQESIQAASSFVRSRAAAYGIKPTLFEKKDIHVHVPEGATPKDGPSAGVAMCTSIVSVLTGIPVKGNVAMTGEISLRGRVLPIGGLKEKLLAAHRGGIKEVLIPEENLKDLEEIPENVKKGLRIIPVAKVDEVLEHALVRKFTPIEWIDENLGDHLVTNVSTGGGTPVIEPSPTTH